MAIWKLRFGDLKQTEKTNKLVPVTCCKNNQEPTNNLPHLH